MRILLLLGVLVAIAAAADGPEKLPAGWFLGENEGHYYETGVDKAGGCESPRAAYVKSKGDRVMGWGTLMQAFTANDYREKRVRFSGSVRTRGVEDWAGLWMRIDGPDPTRPLAFDNMQFRPIRGNTVCKRYDVVLDVPKSATRILFGLLLSGKGQAWLDTVRFDAVDSSVSVTNLLPTAAPQVTKQTAPAPVNIAALQKDDVPTGRVGPIWFNEGRVEGKLPAVATTTAAPAFQPTHAFADVLATGRTLLQQDGNWKSLYGVWTTNGRTVRGTLHNKPASFTIGREGVSTVIRGQLGDYPVLIVVDLQRVVMRWGELARDLERESEPHTEAACVRYSHLASQKVRDDLLDICGVVLSDHPPPIQTILAFLGAGFTRSFERSESPSVPPRYAPEPIAAVVPPSDQTGIPDGRVGQLWFNQFVVGGFAPGGSGGAKSLPTWREPPATAWSASGGRWASELGNFVRQPDGSWKGPAGNVSVAGRTVQGVIDGKPFSCTLERNGKSTVIKGNWANQAILISLSPQRLTMQWGALVRELPKDNEITEKDCVRYARKPAPWAVNDVLEVCGDALSENPPPGPIVLAFVGTGFRPAVGRRFPPVTPLPPIPASAPEQDFSDPQVRNKH